MFFIRVLTILCAFAMITGCGRKKPKYLTNDPFYIKGKKSQQRGHFQDAIKAYESSLKLGKSYAGHLQLAFIYEEQKNYPAQIYHCQKYLALAPDSDSNNALVKSMIKQAEEEQFLVLNKDKKTVAEPKVEVDKDKSKYGEVTPRELLFKEKFVAAAKERERLKRELEAIKGQPQDSRTVIKQPAKEVETVKTPVEEDEKPVVVVEQKPGDAKPVTVVPVADKPKYKIKTVYKVKSGDNLTKISQKFYNTSRHWKKIVEANQPELSDPSKLRIGQKIKIPDLPVKK